MTFQNGDSSKLCEPEKGLRVGEKIQQKTFYSDGIGNHVNRWTKQTEKREDKIGYIHYCVIILTNITIKSILFSCLRYSVLYFRRVDYMVLNGRTIDKWWIQRDLKGSDRGLIWVLSRHLPGETEENHERSKNSWCPARYSNRAHPEYKFKSLRLDQPPRFLSYCRQYTLFVCGHTASCMCACMHASVCVYIGLHVRMQIVK
jgi:hypothetical protein